MEKGAMPWKNRYIGNPLLTWVGRLFFKCKAKDSHCGLRGFTKETYIKMDLRKTGMKFASEMVIKASLLSMKIEEIPTTLSTDGRTRPPHLNPWRDGWRHLRFMILFRPRWLFFIPGMMSLVLKITFYIPLLFGPGKIGNLIFDIHTLFYAQTISILGLLVCCFGLIVRFFGAREKLLPNKQTIDFINSKPILELGGLVSII